MDDKRFCPVHGLMPRSEWWEHGDDCSAMCVDCEPIHTNDVGCAYVTIELPEEALSDG